MSPLLCYYSKVITIAPSKGSFNVPLKKKQSVEKVLKEYSFCPGDLVRLRNDLASGQGRIALHDVKHRTHLGYLDARDMCVVLEMEEITIKMNRPLKDTILENARILTSAGTIGWTFAGYLEKVKFFKAEFR